MDTRSWWNRTATHSGSSCSAQILASANVSNTHGNPRGIDADRCLELPIRAGPSPDTAEHGAVEVAQIFVVQERLRTIRFGDVDPEL